MSKCPLPAPTGIVDFKYSPFIPLLSLSSDTANSFCLRSIPVSIFYYIHVSLLLTPISPSIAPFSKCKIWSHSVHLLYLCPSVFCVHVLRLSQKPAMLECMCSRSRSDCATAGMSFESNCILL